MEVSGRTHRSAPHRSSTSSSRSSQRPLQTPALRDLGLSRKAVGAQCPPWSTPLKAAVRHQSTTLQHRVAEMPSGLVDTQGQLDARRYQPTSADHGLAFRLRDASVLQNSKGIAQSSRSSGTPKPAAAVIRPHVTKSPSWWGQAGGVDESRPSYEDHGAWYPKETQTICGREFLRSESMPLLGGKYEHQNPFTAQW
eukprot:CAMPEP_0115171160 /NCGR_PEP_ID=MMETSP0270-20121206/2161_1 /TAXON_ID=71861 /ORGANISM="Scrippsiella trochoidea, Strain CCMP3099" /LENGTH=195 /DNA_ID=CAMNT_0002583921 /DNA_START=15 /DNA_END=599 /DNA_ORIENTATION=-